MIVTVTANPALDVTYDLAAPLRVGGVHRVRAQRTVPGGKGVNVARVMHQLGEKVLALGFAGGPGGTALRAGLDSDGVAHDFLDVLPDVRRTVVVHDDAGSTTSLWEPGHAPSDRAAASSALLDRVRESGPAMTALAISGSLPPSIDPALPAALARTAAQAGRPVVADVSGDALRAAVEGGDAVVMPNIDELADLVGVRPSGPAEAAALARELLAKHRLPAIVVTLGSAGLIAVTPSGTLWGRLADPLSGNPTGAGDAACAAVVRRVGSGHAAVDWREAVVDAVALSASAVLRPVAGEVDTAAYHDLSNRVILEEL